MYRYPLNYQPHPWWPNWQKEVKHKTLLFFCVYKIYWLSESAYQLTPTRHREKEACASKGETDSVQPKDERQRQTAFIFLYSLAVLCVWDCSVWQLPLSSSFISHFPFSICPYIYIYIYIHISLRFINDVINLLKVTCICQVTSISWF